MPPFPLSYLPLPLRTFKTTSFRYNQSICALHLFPLFFFYLISFPIIAMAAVLFFYLISPSSPLRSVHFVIITPRGALHLSNSPSPSLSQTQFITQVHSSLLYITHTGRPAEPRASRRGRDSATHALTNA